MLNNLKEVRIFNDIKKNSIEIWKTYDNTYGYVDEKLKQIESYNDEYDSPMFIYNMFDFTNQIRLKSLLTTETKDWLEEQYF